MRLIHLYACSAFALASVSAAAAVPADFDRVDARHADGVALPARHMDVVNVARRAHLEPEDYHTTTAQAHADAPLSPAILDDNTSPFALRGANSNYYAREAYKEAASGSMGYPEPGQWFLFMNCVEASHRRATSEPGRQMWLMHRCSHVGLVVGRTHETKKTFDARLFHVKLGPGGWTVSSPTWHPRNAEHLIFVGHPSDDPDLDALESASQRWAEGAGRAITDEHNCVTYYEFALAQVR